ncbi:MAG TPA: hypothetical protein EYN06_01510 [Myxococcales bacterium]|nr:hypothetical protein [Myxococcales bacterium]
MNRLFWIALAITMLLVTSHACSDDDNAGGVADVLTDSISGDGVIKPDGSTLSCQNNDQCSSLEGQDACRKAVCDQLIGSCVLWTKANCCVVADECDDGVDSTIDTCEGDSNLCMHEDTDTPCTVDIECAENGVAPCITFECKGNCVYWKKPDCCTSESDCDDGNSCTSDSCFNFKCGYETSSNPECCGETVFEENFNDASLGGMTATGNEQTVKWHASNKRVFSEGGAARFADPKSNTYSNPSQNGIVPPSQGSLRVQMELPAAAKLSVGFRLWLDMENVPDYDLFFMEVHVEDTVAQVWSKAELSEDQYQAWTQVTVDLTQYAGQTVDLVFVVDTIDGTVNNGEGVYLDDLIVVEGCETTNECVSTGDCQDDNPCTNNWCDAGVCQEELVEDCCVTDGDCATDGFCVTAQCQNNQCVFEVKDCDDGNPCTDDACTEEGQCVHSQIPGCGENCESVSDCNDGNDCTADFCEEGSCVFIEIPGCGKTCETSADCDDKNGCTADFCENGECLNAEIPGCAGDCNDASDCNDKNECTADFCLEGKCQNVAVPGCGTECSSSGECDDDNPCTEDVCNPEGQCVHFDDPNCGQDCQNAGDCNDGNDCTADFCVDGSCQNLVVPGCGAECNTNGDCVDDNPCTNNQCVEGECEFEAIPGCGNGCKTAAECDDLNECTADFCQDEQCQNLAIPGCGVGCTTSAECNDSEACTQDGCVNNVCENKLIAGCVACTAGPVFADNYDTSGGTGWSLANQQEQVGWQVGAFDLFTSSPNSLYYGNPETGDYNTGGKGNSGTATSPAFVVSETADGATINFSIMPDIEGVPNFDKLELVALTGEGQEFSVWAKNDLPPGSFDNEFTEAEADLSALIGHSIKLEFRFASVDGIQNNGTGIVVDDLVVNVSCKAPICTTNNQCDDGNLCTIDACLNGQCATSTKPGCCTEGSECDDGNKCTVGQCVSNTCVFVPIPGCGEGCQNNSDCSSDNPCLMSICNSGQCVSSVIPGCCVDALECDDLDQCTINKCSDNKCVFVPDPSCAGCTDNGQCDDGNLCTADSCSGGKCSNTVIAGCCKTVSDCPDVTCATNNCVANKCIPEPLSGCCSQDSECNDGNICTADVCNGGECVFKAVAGCCTTANDCVDDNNCTSDLCANGQCVNQLVPNCCSSNEDCDDGNPCTKEACSASGQCQFTTVIDCCSVAQHCNDNNPCTTDSCVGNKCSNIAAANCCVNASECDDKNLCTTDHCSNNSCINDPLAGCCLNSGDCEDGNQCTTNSCQNNQCVATSVEGCCSSNNECNDGNPCTADTCNGGTCESAPTGVGDGCCLKGSDCEDGDGCTIHTCLTGVCSTVTLPDCCFSDSMCDDGVTCTENTCVNKQCQTTPKANCCQGAADCDDGVACTVEKCNLASGLCETSSLPGCCTLDAECNDGNTCTADACVNNACQFTSLVGCCNSPLDCDQAATCQTATCLASQCFYEDVVGCCAGNADCGDGDPCTLNTCSNQQCSTSAVVNCCTSDAQCADTDVCTIDSCTGNQCQNITDPGCCTDKIIAAQNFNSGNPGFTIIGTSAAKWQGSKAKSVSPPASWWFGNAATGDYGGDTPGVGSTTTTWLELPAGKKILLTFFMYLDVETSPNFDKVSLELKSSDGTVATVWDKSAIADSDYQQWVAVKVNLTAYVGQKIQLTWTVNTVDTLFNDGEGVFLDDIKFIDSCEDLSGVCVFDGECADGQICTIDSCNNGSCDFSVVPDCCTENVQCNDNYACTADSCGPNNKCLFQKKENCCQFNSECDDGNPCTTDACVGSVCMSELAQGSGCCTADAECDDDNSCTTETCVSNQCKYTADTGVNCCQPASVLDAAFDDASSQGFTVITDGSPAKWSVQGKRFFSPGFSFYYGVPGDWTYKTDNANSGTLISPQITIPLIADKVNLTFHTYLDISTQQFLDPFQVQVLSGSQLKTHWNKNQAGNGTSQQWINVSVDLSEYKGKVIQLYWTMSTLNLPFGNQSGEGVYVDDILVSTTCEEDTDGGLGP